MIDNLLARLILIGHYLILKRKQNEFIIFDRNKFWYANKFYQKPIIIHFPGKTTRHTFLNKLTKYLDQQSTPKEDFNNTQIEIYQINNYTEINTRKNPGEYFLQKFNISYITSGKCIPPQSWKNPIRINLLYDLLMQTKKTKPHKQYFLSFDSTDAILLNAPIHLLNALKEYECDIVYAMSGSLYNGINQKRNIIHLPNYYKKYTKDHYRFLNAGAVFGKIDTMIEILADLRQMIDFTDFKNLPISDQFYYHQIRFKHSNKIGIDYKKKYFLNIYSHNGPFDKYQSG